MFNWYLYFQWGVVLICAWTLQLDLSQGKNSLPILDAIDFFPFSRQEYQNGLPCPPPRGFPNPEIEPKSCIASGPITSWEIDGETVSDFIFWSVKITADGDCSHEIKRRLLLGRKVMTSLDSIFKSRDVTLLTKVHLVKAIVFPVVMYGCESWTVKKAEHRRIDAFELWCWRRLLRVSPLDFKVIQPVHTKGD